MRTPAIQREIDRLEQYAKRGESYANADGRHGWRNPIRSDTGSLLQSLVLARRPARILEIGTAHGLSGMYLAAGLTPGATLETIEFHEAVAREAQELFTATGVPAQVHIGEALEVIRRLEGTFDLVFFDAQKNQYHPQLLALLERGLIGPGTVLLADNVIDRAKECAAFLQWFEQEHVEHHVIPTECGLLVARL